MKEPPVREKPAALERVSEPSPEITALSAKREGVVTKLRGSAYIRRGNNVEYTLLQEGDPVPIGEVFYLSPKTTMKIEQNPDEELYLYSKELQVYYKLVTDGP